MSAATAPPATIVAPSHARPRKKHSRRDSPRSGDASPTTKAGARSKKIAKSALARAVSGGAGGTLSREIHDDNRVDRRVSTLVTQCAGGDGGAATSEPSHAPHVSQAVAPDSGDGDSGSCEDTPSVPRSPCSSPAVLSPASASASLGGLATYPPAAVSAAVSASVPELPLDLCSSESTSSSHPKKEDDRTNAAPKSRHAKHATKGAAKTSHRSPSLDPPQLPRKKKAKMPSSPNNNANSEKGVTPRAKAREVKQNVAAAAAAAPSSGEAEEFDSAGSGSPRSRSRSRSHGHAQKSQKSPLPNAAPALAKQNSGKKSRVKSRGGNRKKKKHRRKKAKKGAARSRDVSPVREEPALPKQRPEQAPQSGDGDDLQRHSSAPFPLSKSDAATAAAAAAAAASVHAAAGTAVEAEVDLSTSLCEVSLDSALASMRELTASLAGLQRLSSGMPMLLPPEISPQPHSSATSPLSRDLHTSPTALSRSAAPHAHANSAHCVTSRTHPTASIPATARHRHASALPTAAPPPPPRPFHAPFHPGLLSLPRFSAGAGDLLSPPLVSNVSAVLAANQRAAAAIYHHQQQQQQQHQEQHTLLQQQGPAYRPNHHGNSSGNIPIPAPACLNLSSLGLTLESELRNTAHVPNRRRAGSLNYDDYTASQFMLPPPFLAVHSHSHGPGHGHAAMMQHSGASMPTLGSPQFSHLSPYPGHHDLSRSPAVTRSPVSCSTEGKSGDARATSPNPDTSSRRSVLPTDEVADLVHTAAETMQLASALAAAAAAAKPYSPLSRSPYRHLHRHSARSRSPSPAPATNTPRQHQQSLPLRRSASPQFSSSPAASESKVPAVALSRAASSPRRDGAAFEFVVRHFDVLDKAEAEAEADVKASSRAAMRHHLHDRSGDSESVEIDFSQLSDDEDVEGRDVVAASADAAAPSSSSAASVCASRPPPSSAAPAASSSLKAAPAAHAPSASTAEEEHRRQRHVHGHARGPRADDASACMNSEQQPQDATAHFRRRPSHTRQPSAAMSDEPGDSDADADAAATGAEAEAASVSGGVPSDSKSAASAATSPATSTAPAQRATKAHSRSDSSPAAASESSTAACASSATQQSAASSTPMCDSDDCGEYESPASSGRTLSAPDRSSPRKTGTTAKPTTSTTSSSKHERAVSFARDGGADSAELGACAPNCKKQKTAAAGCDSANACVDSSSSSSNTPCQSAASSSSSSSGSRRSESPAREGREAEAEAEATSGAAPVSAVSVAKHPQKQDAVSAGDSLRISPPELVRTKAQTQSGSEDLEDDLQDPESGDICDMDVSSDFECADAADTDEKQPDPQTDATSRCSNSDLHGVSGAQDSALLSSSSAGQRDGSASSAVAASAASRSIASSVVLLAAGPGGRLRMPDLNAQNLPTIPVANAHRSSLPLPNFEQVMALPRAKASGSGSRGSGGNRSSGSGGGSGGRSKVPLHWDLCRPLPLASGVHGHVGVPRDSRYHISVFPGGCTPHRAVYAEPMVGCMFAPKEISRSMSGLTKLLQQ